MSRRSPPWTCVEIHGGDFMYELFSDDLASMGAQGLVIEENTIKAFFPPGLWTDSIAGDLQQRLQQLQESGVLSTAEFDAFVVEQGDWIAAWRNSLGPIRAGEHFVIVPSSAMYDPEPDDIVLPIEPRMAFGTGEHPTTQMALALLEPQAPTARRVLDLGCGNGILTLGALALGSAIAVAIDNEEDAVRETLENAQLAGYQGRLQVLLGSALEPVVKGSFDLILANILLNVNLAGLPLWTGYAAPGCRLILTGVRAEENDEARRLNEAALQAGWTLEEEKTNRGWYAARYFRP